MTNGTRDVLFTPRRGAHSRGGASWRVIPFCFRVSRKIRNRFCGRCKPCWLAAREAGDRGAAASLHRSASRHQVNHHYNQRNDKQQVDQAAGHVEPPAEKPENDKNRKNGPKHIYPLKWKSVQTSS